MFERRYSLAKFSVNLETKTIEIAETFSEALNSVAGVAIPVDVRERYADAVQGYTRGTISVVSTTVKMSANIVAQFTAAERLAAEVGAIKNLRAALTSADSLAAAVQGSKHIPTIVAAYEALNANGSASKNICTAFVAADILTAIMDATSQTAGVVLMQVTIPPGGELRLDSDVFLAMLDGENVLYAQSGDWINVSRELLRLIVESATGGALEGQIIYTERYL